MCYNKKYLDCMTPLQDWGRFWWGWRLGVHTFSHLFYVLSNWNLFQVNLPILTLLGFELCFCIGRIRVFLTIKLAIRCVSKFCVGHIQTRHVYFLSPNYWIRLWQGCHLCDCTFRNQFIYCQKDNNPMFFCSFLCRFVPSVEY